MPDADADLLLARGRAARDADRPAVCAAVASLAADGRAEDALRLAVATWRLWVAAGDLAGGRAMLAPALAAATGAAAPLRAHALYADGLLAFRQGRQEESRACNEQALALARAARDPECEALALVGLSRVAFRDGDYERVCRLADDARALVAGLAPAAGVAPLHMLAAGTRLLGRLDEAAALYRESLALNRGLGDERMVAVELHNLGHVELRRGDLGTARDLFAAAAAARDGSRDPYDVAMDLLNRAALAAVDGDDAALGLLEEAERTLAQAGIALDPDDRFELDDLRARLRRQPPNPLDAM